MFDFHLNLGIFYMPQIYGMGPTALLPLRRKGCWGFFRPKNPTASAGFEPANLGTKGQHATPRPPKPVTFLYRTQLDTHTHTHTHPHPHLHAHIPSKTSLSEWSARRKDRCRHNTQQTQAHSRIRTRDPSHRPAVNLRLTPGGHRVRQTRHYVMGVTVKIAWLHQNEFVEEEDV